MIDRISLFRRQYWVRLCCRKVGLALGLAAISLALPEPSFAYRLEGTGSCTPGKAWDISSPVKVKLLSDSYTDYALGRGHVNALTKLARAIEDIEAVIAVYNAVPGSGLRLEYAGGIVGDDNLEDPDDEVFDNQTIVIGFTDLRHETFPGAEAWAATASADGCTYTRRHLMFRKDFDWTFGPPETTDVSGRTFGDGEKPISFRGILTHEMGHAIGLNHPKDDYAIMAQNVVTWMRGPDNVPRTQLLPDDMAGVLALYGTSNIRTFLDVSVTNSWFLSALQQAQCAAEEAAIGALEVRRDQQEAILEYLQGAGRQAALNTLAGIQTDLAAAERALGSCQDRGNATQIQNCRVSGRGDSWADRADGLVLCGVNAAAGSDYPAVSRSICPRGYLQLRYTLNNHSMFRDAQLKTEVWLSRDNKLNLNRRRHRKSPDAREFTLSAGKSATVGQVYRLPADAADGEVYWVFLRAVPHDIETGESLWASDADKWNNAIMLRSSITVSSAACA